MAMSALAISLHKLGHTVTGSDKGFYPPVSNHLKEAGISYYPGWHVEKMTKNGNPDLVVVGNVAGSQNPEWLCVQKNGIDYVSYPELMERMLIKKNSIVCAGTYGKSTSTALLACILAQNGRDPSYMFGGVPQDGMLSARISDSPWSVVEGDEYKTAKWDEKAKFFHYAPTHLLLTSVVWDHADVYPTEEDYINAFAELVGMLPDNGLLIVSGKVLHQNAAIIQRTAAPVVTYGKTADNDYQYTNVASSTVGVDFDILHKDITYHVHTNELGDYMADNMTGCFALCHEIGLNPDDIIAAIQSFKNIKRRLEKRFDHDVTVFDDIAHSPKKAEAVLRSLRQIYHGHIYAVFEPNTGNRLEESIPGYDGAFAEADTVIIPRLSIVKRVPGKPAPLNGHSLTSVIQKTHRDVRYVEDDDQLVAELAKAKDGDVIVFLGSHGFRGMIEALVSKLQG